MFFTSYRFGSIYEQIWIVFRASYICNALSTFFEKIFQKKIVGCAHMIMLVRLNALLGILFIDLIIIMHPFNYILVNWYWIKSDFDSFEVEF